MKRRPLTLDHLLSHCSHDDVRSVHRGKRASMERAGEQRCFPDQEFSQGMERDEELPEGGRDRGARLDFRPRTGDRRGFPGTRRVFTLHSGRFSCPIPSSSPGSPGSEGIPWAMILDTETGLSIMISESRNENGWRMVDIRRAEDLESAGGQHGVRERRGCQGPARKGPDSVHQSAAPF